MKIRPTDPVRLRPDGADPTRPQPAGPAPVSASTRRDRVEISAAALEASRRDGADRSTANHGAHPIPFDAPSRMELIAARLTSGFYDRPDVLEAVSRRLLASGDLASGEGTSE